MTTLRSHAILDHDADRVWEVIRDAGSIADWFPAMTGSSIDASIRRVTLGDGSVLEEEIVTSDDSLRRLQYRVIGGDLPVTAHLGTVDVLEVAQGRSLLVYSTEIDPAELAPAFESAVSEAVGGLNGFLDARGR